MKPCEHLKFLSLASCPPIIHIPFAPSGHRKDLNILLHHQGAVGPVYIQKPPPFCSHTSQVMSMLCAAAAFAKYLPRTPGAQGNRWPNLVTVCIHQRTVVVRWAKSRRSWAQAAVRLCQAARRHRETRARTNASYRNGSQIIWPMPFPRRGRMGAA